MAENRRRALVGDDNPVTRKVIMATLEADGFEVSGAGGNAAAAFTATLEAA